MKGIILAGGYGTRLYTSTIAVSKQLLPVYDKPMIYYPLSNLMLAGIREILIISNPEEKIRFQTLLGSGNQWGLSFTYLIQEKPGGLAESFLIGKQFIGDDEVCLILGDNIFFGTNFGDRLRNASKNVDGAVIFAYPVKEPSGFGVVELDDGLNAVSLEEKPSNPKSNLAVPGIYFYDNQVLDLVTKIKPSNRGELKITDINKAYMEMGKLRVEFLGRGTAWLDAGTHITLLQAASFIQTVQERQGMMISSPEEIAFKMGYINKNEVHKQAKKYINTSYGDYLLNI